MRDRVLYWAGLALLGWALLTFLFVPLGLSLVTAFLREGELRIGAAMAELAASRRVRQAVWNTLWMTAASTATVTAMGVFQVLVLEYYHVRGRRFLSVAFAIPLVFGSVVAASGYNFAYGPNGVVTAALGLPPGWFQGWAGVLAIHTMLLTSFFYLFLRAAMRRVDHATIEAARSLGASEARILARVVLPVVLPTLLAVILLTVYTAIGSFAAPQILGGRDFHMLSQTVLTLTSLRRPDMAALLALGMGVIVMALILASQHFEARAAAGGARSPAPIQLRRIRAPWLSALVHGLAYLVAGLSVLPVALVVLFSFAPSADIGVRALPSSLSLETYARVLGGGAGGAPFWNSVRMGLIAVAAALAVSLFAVPILLRAGGVLARLLDLGLFLPWIVPSILLAVGLIAAFDTPNPLIGGGVLLGSFWILPVGYTIVALPLMVRVLRAAFAGLDPAQEEAARSLGAPALYRFRRVTLPLVLPTAVLVAGMTFNDLMTEYPLSAFLYNVNNRPLPIAIVDGATSPDPEQKALTLVYSTLIMAFSLAVILVAERIGLGRGPKTNRL